MNQKDNKLVGVIATLLPALLVPSLRESWFQAAAVQESAAWTCAVCSE